MDANRVAANLHLDAQNDGIEHIVVRHSSALRELDKFMVREGGRFCRTSG
jgi:hypothetical protein